jgi:hypothetical protein
MYFIFCVLLISTLVVMCSSQGYRWYRSHSAAVLQRNIHQLNMPWVHSVHHGSMQWHVVKALKRDFFADAEYSIVVQRDGAPVGVIGFSCGRYLRTVRIMQMQGFKGVHFNGGPFGRHLLSLSEELFGALGCVHILVQSAQASDYWSCEDSTLTPPEIRARRDRLVEKYNKTPKDLGYQLQSNGSWWHKALKRG